MIIHHKKIAAYVILNFSQYIIVKSYTLNLLLAMCACKQCPAITECVHVGSTTRIQFKVELTKNRILDVTHSKCRHVEPSCSDSVTFLLLHRAGPRQHRSHSSHFTNKPEILDKKARQHHHCAILSKHNMLTLDNFIT